MSWLPSPKRIQPEHIRRAAMDDYANLQKFKLKVVLVLAFALWVYHGCPLP